MACDRLSAVVVVAVLSVGFHGPALAVGGGGDSGMSSAPSESAPSFDPAAEYQKGMNALKALDYRTAERAFTNVSRLAPRDANVWLVLGMSKGGRGDLKGAQKAYETSLKNDPKLVAAHRELAITLAKLKQTDRANAELGTLKQRAAACANTCPEASVINQAVTAVEAALASGAPSARLEAPSLPNAQLGDAAYLKAVSLINEHRYQDALTALAEARQAFGPHPDVLTYQGYVNRKLGDFTAAEGYYRQALQLAPNHRGAMEYYGELKVVRGDMAGAKDLLAKLDKTCTFGCSQAEDLRRWIANGGEPSL